MGPTEGPVSPVRLTTPIETGECSSSSSANCTINYITLHARLPSSLTASYHTCNAVAKSV
jgi:hypothetical protein